MTLKIATSQLWGHTFMWCHRRRRQSTGRRHFPTGPY